MIDVNLLWKSDDPELWSKALKVYVRWIKPQNLNLEREFEALDAEKVKCMSPRAWYDFLHDDYFRWKYTAPNRYATTTKHLRRHLEDDGLSDLVEIRNQLFAFDRDNVETGLKLALQIYGLGVAGASGLLAVLFPSDFGTVDQFVVKALKQVPSLSESIELNRMNAESLNVRDGVLLINMMRRKANQLNSVCRAGADSLSWTPRKVDMVLWASRQSPCRH